VDTGPALPTWSVVVAGQLSDGETLPARGANSLAFSREREENPSVDTPLARRGNTSLSERFLGRLLADDTAIVRGDALCLVELRGFEPLTPCMPCSFGLLCLPRSAACSQANGLLRVTVTVRWIPLLTAAYGTRVARPARTTWLAPGGDGSQLDVRTRPAPGDQGRRWQAANAVRQPWRRNLRSSRRMHQRSPVGRHAALTLVIGLLRMSRLPSRWW